MSPGPSSITSPDKTQSMGGGGGGGGEMFPPAWWMKDVVLQNKIRYLSILFLLCQFFPALFGQERVCFVVRLFRFQFH